MSDEKLIYLMNHYSHTDASHFSHVLGLLEEMSSQGTRILLIIEKSDVKPKVNAVHIEVRRLPSELGPIRRWLFLVRAVSRARRDGYRTAFVRISTWSALAAIVALWGDRGKVFYWQSGTTIEFDREQPWGWSKLKWSLRSALPSRLVWTLCDRFVTGPTTMADYYANVGGVDRKKIRVLHNDVDHRRFLCSGPRRADSRRKVREKLDLSDKTTLLLFVHRLSPVRRTLNYLPLAMTAVRRAGLLEETCLVVVGGGPDLSDLKRWCDDAGLRDNVRFLGDQPNMGIEEFYYAADVFLQPTHAEGFPRVLVEAMVAGLPVVTTDAGGSGEILGPLQQDFVTPKDCPDKFGVALVALVRDRSIWGELSHENQSLSKIYDTPLVAAMYRELLFRE